jgi:hypothetical protein
MKGVTVSALVLAPSLGASFVWAEDFKGDHSACWDEPRQDMSCTKLTDRFLMSLRFKTRRAIQQAMNSAGRETNPNNPDYDPRGLHFISNYTRGKEDGSGVVNFVFNKDGKAVIIYGEIDTANSASLDDFRWNADLLPEGCFDGPHTTMHRCRR